MNRSETAPKTSFEAQKNDDVDELADDLHDRKSCDDSYEDMIWRLVERADGENTDTERGHEQEAKA